MSGAVCTSFISLLPSILLVHLIHFLAGLHLSRRLRQVQSPPPHHRPHGLPIRAASRSSLRPERRPVRHRRRPVLRSRSAWQRHWPGGDLLTTIKLEYLGMNFTRGVAA